MYFFKYTGYFLCRQSTIRNISQDFFEITFFCIISEKNLTGIVLSAIRQQIDLLVEADDIISGIDHLPEQELNVKVFDDQLGALHQEEERYRDLKAKLYQDMAEGLVTRDEFVQINQRFTKKLENAKNRTEEIIKKRQNLIMKKDGIAGEFDCLVVASLYYCGKTDRNFHCFFICMFMNETPPKT